MELTPSVRDRLKGARELARAHEATIRAGEAILAALDVLFPDDDDEPVYGEGQAAADLAEAEAHRETAEILSDPDTMAALREAEAETADDAAHRSVLDEVAAGGFSVSAHLRGEEAAEAAEAAEHPDYAASSAGQAQTPPPPSCWRCEGVDREEAWAVMLGLCYRHAADERDLARGVSVQVHELAQENARLAGVVHEQAVDIARLRRTLGVVRSALSDAS